MRKTISTYWPVAMLVPIALAGYLHTVGADQPSAAPHEQMTVAEVSAEFARAISLGFVDADGDWQPAGSMPAVAAAPRVL